MLDFMKRTVTAQPDTLEALRPVIIEAGSSASGSDASDDKLRNGPEAARLAERALRLPPVKGMCVAGTLVVAYAEAGRFPEAIATAEKAVREEAAAGGMRFANSAGNY